MVIRQHEAAQLPPLQTLPGTISASAYEIMQRMMAKRREDRFEGYQPLIEALEGC